MLSKIQNILILILLIACAVFVFLYKQQREKSADLQTKIDGLAPGITKTVTVEKNSIKTIYRDKDGKVKTESKYVPPEGKVTFIYKTDPEVERQLEASKQQIALLKTQNETLKSNISDLKSKIEDANTKLVSLSTEYDQALSKKEQLLKEYEDAKNNGASEEELQAKLDEINSINGKLNSLAADRAQLETDLNTYKANLETLDKQREDLLKKNEDLNSTVASLQNKLDAIQQPVTNVKWWGFRWWNPQLGLVYKASPVFGLNSFEPTLSDRFFYINRFGAGLGVSLSQVYLFSDYRLDQIYLPNTTIGAYIGKDWTFATTWGIKLSVFF